MSELPIEYRSTAQKRADIEKVMSDTANAGLGKRKIAELAGVSKPMVIDYIARKNGLSTTTERKRSKQ